VFFYLDAHWNADLPLNAELDLIGTHWQSYVIMIDDFQVPDDNGYGYDDYGPGKVLDLSLLEAQIKKYNLKVFFPAARSNEESGGKRGCVVLASGDLLSQKLARLSSLRQWK
jgi:hypothetical protein